MLQPRKSNVGVYGGLLDQKHTSNMGMAIWLFLWCIHRQTKIQDGLGWVLGGSCITYRMIENDTGWKRGTIRRWFRQLQQHRYLLVKFTGDGLRIAVRNAKKFGPLPVEKVVEIQRKSAARVSTSGQAECSHLDTRIKEGMKGK